MAGVRRAHSARRPAAPRGPRGPRRARPRRHALGRPHLRGRRPPGRRRAVAACPTPPSPTGRPSPSIPSAVRSAADGPVGRRRRPWKCATAIRCRGAGLARFEGCACRSPTFKGSFITSPSSPASWSTACCRCWSRAASRRRPSKRDNQLPPPGIHRLRRPGSASELLDLRDYLPGDPPKNHRLEGVGPPRPPRHQGVRERGAGPLHPVRGRLPFRPRAVGPRQGARPARRDRRRRPPGQRRRARPDRPVPLRRPRVEDDPPRPQPRPRHAGACKPWPTPPPSPPPRPAPTPTTSSPSPTPSPGKSTRT